MMWLKSCPRCQGDLYARNDSFGPYIACAQCGHTLNAVQELALKPRTVTQPVHQRSGVLRSDRSAAHPGSSRGVPPERRVAAGSR